MRLRERQCRLHQVIARNIDGHVTRRLHGIDKDRRFGAAATAVFDQQCLWPDACCHTVRMLTHDAKLGASRVILGQVADRLEQLGATLIVEIFCR